MKTNLLLFMIVFSGCGDGGMMGPGYSKPFATLHGRITQSSVAVTSPEVRVALVWEKLDESDAAMNTLRVAQELGVRTQFPVDFQIDVNQLPPEEAMNRIPMQGTTPAYWPNVRVAIGTILVYEDTNRNGVADLVPIGATTSIDRVLGVAPNLSVIYIEGDPPPPSASNGIAFARGFNLAQSPSLTLAPGQCSAQSSGTFAILPLSTTIEIALSAQPELATYLCAQAPPMGGSGSGMCTAGPNGVVCPPDLPPPGATVCCGTDRSYVYRYCPAPTSLCAGTLCQYGGGYAMQPLPADWPCP